MAEVLLADSTGSTGGGDGRQADPRDLGEPARRWLHSRVHSQPELRYRLPQDAPFATAWGSGIYLAALAAKLPAPLLAWWAAQPAGYVLLTAVDAGYVPGELPVHDPILRGVARLPLALLAQDPLAALAVALSPLDHLLGCRGEERGLWLSDGGGLTPAWQEIGRQIHSLFGLGYGLTLAAQVSSRDYFAQGLALTLLDRSRLNTADPKLERLLGATLLNPGFCRNHLPQAG